MSLRSNTLRRMIGLIALLALTAQGVAQASADVAAEAQGQHHCDGHESAQQDCTCCPDPVPMSGCAGLCSMATAPACAAPDVALAVVDRATPANEACLQGPTYLPLNPPPIA